MNGVHDMGGMQGMGPIRYEKNEPVFHARWEGRVFALTRAMAAWRKWNIDASRHGIELIPAFTPQARGRGEQLWETWQGRLPQELRVAGITTIDEANRYLEDVFIPKHNRLFTVPARESETAFVPVTGIDLDRVFSLHHERLVGNDNTVQFERKVLQIPKAAWRFSFAKCRVQVYEHLDGTLSVGHGPHVLGRYTADGGLLTALSAKVAA